MRGVNWLMVLVAIVLATIGLTIFAMNWNECRQTHSFLFCVTVLGGK